MFYRIETKTVTLGLFHHPARPVFYLLGDGVITKVDVFAHQVIEIAQLAINLVVPALAGIVIDDLKDAVLVRIFDVVDAAEAFEIPDKLRVLTATRREGVTGPAFAVDDLIRNLRAILFVDSLYADALFLVRPHFVIYHHVEQHRDVIFSAR